MLSRFCLRTARVSQDRELSRQCPASSQATPSASKTEALPVGQVPMPLSCHMPQTTAERHAGYGGCTFQWVKREMTDVPRTAELPLAEWGPRPRPQARFHSLCCACLSPEGGASGRAKVASLRETLPAAGSCRLDPRRKEAFSGPQRTLILGGVGGSEENRPGGLWVLLFLPQISPVSLLFPSRPTQTALPRA